MSNMEKYRLLSKTSKAEMAKKLNVHPLTYDKYENDNDLVPLGKAKVFCQVVNKSIEEVFFCPGAVENVAREDTN